MTPSGETNSDGCVSGPFVSGEYDTTSPCLNSTVLIGERQAGCISSACRVEETGATDD